MRWGRGFASIACVALCWATIGAAQDSTILDRTQISGLSVSKLETPRDGLSCQAFCCLGAGCTADTADAAFRLWGSARRNAVTPMVGMAATRGGATRARLVIGGTSFPLEQSKGSRGDLFIAASAQDDTRIVSALASQSRTTARFESDQGRATFRMQGVAQILAYFERECGIARR